jgi:predicted lysophospholipase L1 biosynthesis ABC-type transport system permease subunit
VSAEAVSCLTAVCVALALVLVLLGAVLAERDERARRDGKMR